MIFREGDLGVTGTIIASRYNTEPGDKYIRYR